LGHLENFNLSLAVIVWLLLEAVDEETCFVSVMADEPAIFDLSADFEFVTLSFFTFVDGPEDKTSIFLATKSEAINDF
jgi:hypothetical protein